jgi:hypothetical protein
VGFLLFFLFLAYNYFDSPTRGGVVFFFFLPKAKLSDHTLEFFIYLSAKDHIVVIAGFPPT